MFVTKTEFAALAKVSQGRVSQWISEGKIGRAELDGEGRYARINLEAAFTKLNLHLDLDAHEAGVKSDSLYLNLESDLIEALAAALQWKLNGKPKERRAAEAGKRLVSRITAIMDSLNHQPTSVPELVEEEETDEKGKADERYEN